MINRSLTESLPYVYSQDPALNRESPEFDWPKFLETSDIKHAPCKAGEELTVFTLGRLSRKQMVRVTRYDGLECAVETVAYGVRDVKHYKCGGEDLPIARKKTDIGERLNEETLDRMFDSALFLELATRIMDISRLPPPSAQG